MTSELYPACAICGKQMASPRCAILTGPNEHHYIKMPGYDYYRWTINGEDFCVQTIEDEAYTLLRC